MWSTLSSTRWVFLLSLAAVLLCSEGQSFIRLPCCRTLFKKTPGNITKCFEQLPRWRCNIHAYVIKKQNGSKVCIDPNSSWIKDKLNKGLECRSDVSISQTQESTNHELKL